MKNRRIKRDAAIMVVTVAAQQIILAAAPQGATPTPHSATADGAYALAASAAQRGRKLHLERAGRIYFATFAALLVLGWLIAPRVGAAFWPSGTASPTLTRVFASPRSAR